MLEKCGHGGLAYEISQNKNSIRNWVWCHSGAILARTTAVFSPYYEDLNEVKFKQKMD